MSYTNGTKDLYLDAQHPAVENAIDKLWQEQAEKYPDKDVFHRDLIQIFESVFDCRVVVDTYGSAGRVHFKSPKLKTHFLLKYGS